MVRWSQVSLAAGYLVELRPVNGGVPGGHTDILLIPFIVEPSRIRTSIAAQQIFLQDPPFICEPKKHSNCKS